MTVWVFGDSFSQPAEDMIPEQWMNRLAESLGTTAKSLAVNGSSLEFTYHRFNIARKKIVENDVVIINITDINRRWFFKAHPSHNKDTSPTGDKRETKAIELYRQHLDHNKEINQTYLIDFLYNVHALTEKLNLKTIFLINFLDQYDFLKNVMQNYPLFVFAKGLLVDVTLYEYTHEFFEKENAKGNMGEKDPRLNHLCKTNHLILANKIYDNIKNNVSLDLTNGFTKHIFSEEALNNPQFIKYELFDNAAQKIYDKV